MNRIVLDASAIMAIIDSEPGAEVLTPKLLSGAVASSVNLAEVQTKLVSRGWTFEAAWEDATSAVLEVVPFDGQQARLAGDLVARTKSLGLSLGDRACIALGALLKLPVYTCERSWKKLTTDHPIHIIR